MQNLPYKIAKFFVVTKFLSKVTNNSNLGQLPKLSKNCQIFVVTEFSSKVTNNSNSGLLGKTCLTKLPNFGLDKIFVKSED